MSATIDLEILDIFMVSVNHEKKNFTTDNDYSQHILYAQFQHSTFLYTWFDSTASKPFCGRQPFLRYLQVTCGKMCDNYISVQ